MVFVHKLLKLMVSLFRDPRVPLYLKVLTGGVIVYIALPIDALPDIVPIGGIADELVVIFLVLTQYIKSVPNDVFMEHWEKTMGGNENLEVEMNKSMEILEPLIGEKFDMVNKYANIVIDKYLQRFGKKTVDADEDTALPEAAPESGNPEDGTE